MSGARIFTAAVSVAIGAHAAVAATACGASCDCAAFELDVGAFHVASASLNGTGQTVQSVLPGLITDGRVQVTATRVTISYPADDGTLVTVSYGVQDP